LDPEIDRNNNAENKKKKFKRKTKEGNKKYRSIQMPNGVIFNGLSTTKNPTSGDGQLIYTDGSIYIG
jgi:hypothetical protein